MTHEIIIIPADPRYPLDKQPLITNEMKAECIGEFEWEEEAPYYDEHGELHDHTATPNAAIQRFIRWNGWLCVIVTRNTVCMGILVGVSQPLKS